MELLKVIAFIATISVLIPIVVGLYSYQRQDIALKFLVAFLVIAGVVDGFSTYMAINKIQNMWLINIFVLLQYVLLTLLFSCWHKTSTKSSLRISIVLFTILWGVRSIINGFNIFDDFSYSLSSVLLAGMAIYTLVLFQRERQNLSGKAPQFWVSAIVLIFYGGNILIHSFQPKLSTWPVHNMLSITANLSYAWGLLWISHKSLIGP